MVFDLEQRFSEIAVEFRLADELDICSVQNFGDLFNYWHKSKDISFVVLRVCNRPVNVVYDGEDGSWRSEAAFRVVCHRSLGSPLVLHLYFKLCP